VSNQVFGSTKIRLVIFAVGVDHDQHVLDIHMLAPVL
jgi:hypothetical protein